MLSFTTSDFLIRPFDDGNFFVFVNGEEIDSINYENKILTIPYTANTEKIEVYGSYVIPEFGPIAIIILAVSMVSIIALSRKNSISYSLSNAWIFDSSNPFCPKVISRNTPLRSTSILDGVPGSAYISNVSAENSFDIK